MAGRLAIDPCDNIVQPSDQILRAVGKPAEQIYGDTFHDWALSMAARACDISVEKSSAMSESIFKHLTQACKAASRSGVAGLMLTLPSARFLYIHGPGVCPVFMSSPQIVDTVKFSDVFC